MASIERLLPESEVAELLGVTPRCLQNWRLTGGGPAYVRMGHRSVRYRVSDLDAWASERTFRHTSEEST